MSAHEPRVTDPGTDARREPERDSPAGGAVLEPVEPASVRPPPSPQQMEADFYAQLRMAHERAGALSYRDLSRMSGCSVSTISRTLSGQTFPRWDSVKHLLTVLDDRGGLDDLGEASDMSWWFDRYLEVRACRRGEEAPPAVVTLFPPRTPADAESTRPQPSGTECPHCGAWVTNARRHRAWHSTADQPRHRNPGPSPNPGVTRGSWRALKV
jgi:transcriptional regulator with XRE-family HTH domain